MSTALNKPALPQNPADKIHWGELIGSAQSLAIIEALKLSDRPLLLIAPDNFLAAQLTAELRFFAPSDAVISHFPDWETLPYDNISPHQDIISKRFHILRELSQLKSGIIVCSISNLMQRIAPQAFVDAHHFSLKEKTQLDPHAFRKKLTDAGYRHVTQVMEHGEFVTRGAMIDIFPMGHQYPYRIELFDNDIESIRSFDPDTQRSIQKVNEIALMPAKEFPLTEDAITLFRQQWRTEFTGNPALSPLYQDISEGFAPAGIEYFLPLFFEKTATLIDYLPENSLIIRCDTINDSAKQFWNSLQHRYDQLAHDITRPILPPEKLFANDNELFAQCNQFAQIFLHDKALEEKTGNYCFKTTALPDLSIDHQQADPLEKLLNFIHHNDTATLLCAETAGRRESLNKLLSKTNPKPLKNWLEFEKQTDAALFMTTAAIYRGFQSENYAFITETELFGQQALQTRRQKTTQASQEAVIRNLAELNIGDPVVHLTHGVGRYQGLESMTVDQIIDEYLVLIYADNTKLYVPVAQLQVISRYMGADAEHAPLHRLGSDQWERAKQKAAKRVYDVAAELLAIYSKRASKKAFQFADPDEQYEKFAQDFPFEPTPDQAKAINEVIHGMCTDKPMDHLVCGDVGFGKTEVAMRAAFLAVASNKQVAILVPTTLLAQQHFENFQDRFANWPIEVEVLSRFRSAKEQKSILEKLNEGKVDIVIGTHRLLQKDLKFKNLGLIIIDEEHRFGVRHKEKLKNLREEIDILTLTATPIPRTLNMALSGTRDLSIIATPPAKRLSIKTFVTERKDHIIREAISRELLRGGQVYFLHNSVATIEKTAADLQALIPEARISVAHGQMRERQLEHVMSEFHHRKFNVLVCTTIIESGIDIPSANTILIDRADKFGLSQLHQLRGRVGRSHHQAYAYLLTPHHKALTRDAKKRLEAIAALEDLGIGFTLATHDLEIRGAGEMLGAEQSGHIEEIGFTLYMSMLEKAVQDLKDGKTPNFNAEQINDLEINVGSSAIIPDTYLPDVQARLVLYKRIASVENQQALDELRVEMIDRFGPLPEATKTLLAITEIKLIIKPLGIKRISLGAKNGVIEFLQTTTIEPKKLIQLLQSGQDFRMNGPNKLKFILKSDDKEARIAVLKDIINQLI